MACTVSTVARTRALTTPARVRAEITSITDAASDPLLASLIDRATAAIERYTNRRFGFGRQAYSDTVPGFGGRDLQLSVGPLISVSAVTQDSNAVTDYSIGNRDAGWLYRRLGWDWTPGHAVGLTGRQRWPSWQDPMPGTEEPLVAVTHVSGYLLPGDNLIGKTTLSAASSDNSFNDTASGFPALAKAGDIIRVSGYQTAGNNGKFRLTGTQTTAKLIVDATLTTEAAGPRVAIEFLGHAEARDPADLEKACIETVKSYWSSLNEDSGIVEKAAASFRVRYREGAGPDPGLPPLAAAMLGAWRWAA